jgi:hypothetical protein
MKKLAWSSLALVAAVSAAFLATAQEPNKKAGPGPADAGVTKDGAAFKLPQEKKIEVPPPRPLSVEKLDVRELAAGTSLGKAGDILVTLYGTGFLLTAKAPRLILGELTLENTEINRDGTELYVVLPRQELDSVARMEFEKVVVQNPGTWKEGAGSVEVRARPADLVRAEEGAEPVRVTYREGAFVRLEEPGR